MAESSGTALRDSILKALSHIQDPDLSKDIVSAGFVKDIIVKKTLLGAHDVSVTIELTTPACPVKDWFKTEAERLLKEIPTVREVHVNMTARVRKNPLGTGPTLAGVKNIIAVGSGKGGVGKSAVAVNLAFALKKLGSRVGILDADIHGPSLAQMLNLKGMPEVKDARIIPKLAFDVPVMTFAFFAPVGDAVILRGASTGKAVEQMLFDVNWDAFGELDYLIVDMPPGTGDVPLTLMHKVQVAGAIVVSTPQELSWIDAVKGVAMFEKLKVPVLGIVENMSGFICPHCNKLSDIFGRGGAKARAEARGVPFLGSIPLDPILVQLGDQGVPLLVQQPDSPLSHAFIQVAQATVQQLAVAQAKFIASPESPA